MKIKEIVVVEGKNDANKLNEIFEEVTCITTNGSQIPKGTIEMLKEVSKDRGIILFLDPDGPGKIIRAKIEKEIKNCKHAFIEQKEAISKNKKKVGIEHAKKEVIIKAIKDVYEPYEGSNSIFIEDIIRLGLIGLSNSAQLRRKVSEELKIGYPNAKQFLKRINAFNIELKTIEKIVEDK